MQRTSCSQVDDSLVGKLSNFTSKNRLQTQVTGNCATQGVVQHSQGASLTGKVQLYAI
jgi:hypothetical protein